MMTDCRPIFADERSASRAVFCHAIIPPNRRPFLVSGAGNVSRHTTAPHALERALVFRVQLPNHIRIDIPSGGCQLNRKNALFAGHDAGAQNWGIIASLIETCKLNAIDPQTYLTDTLTAIVNNHRQSDIAVLLPWNYRDNV